MRHLLIPILFLFSILAGNAQETIRTMFYNILDFPEALPTNRPEILKDILDEFSPDIFMVCELQSEEGALIILEDVLNHSSDEYRMAPFIPSESGDLDHQQLIFYRKKMFDLEEVQAIGTEVRDINYYQLKLSTADQSTDPVLINIFVTHLKSSPGNANELLRLAMVEEFVDKVNTFDPDSFVLFSGDFNFYSSLEPAYQEMLNPENHITMADPLGRPGNWHENLNFMDIHSQSTRISSGPFGAGAGGGMDDRFDFIMISDNMLDNPKLQYVPDSYRVVGNNGNCFKKSINDPDCTGYYSQELRNNLYNFSDHLPIVMDLVTEKEIVLSTPEFVVQNPLTVKETLVKDFLNLEIHPDFANQLSFEIYNVLGQKLLDISPSNQSKLSIDLRSFADGVYYLKTNLSSIPTVKFVKTS